MDHKSLEKHARQVIEEQPEAVERYSKGSVPHLGFLSGCLMRKTGSDASTARRAIVEYLK